MSKEHLETYLNDHLAGSVAAIELLDHLTESQQYPPLRGFFVQLKSEVEGDQKELKSLMERRDLSESVARRASAWLAGKVTELKLALDDTSGGDLRLMESLEFLSLGIEGKRLLWIALAATDENVSAFQRVDFGRLIKSAEDQRARVDEQRVAAARKALQT